MKSYLSEYFPKNQRDKFWFIASGAKREMLNFPDYYNNILNNYPDYIPCLFEQTIDKDLTRTFPDEKFYQQKENLAKLRNILIAFSRRNSTIGYIQGFNIIAGRILEVIKDEVIIILYYYIIIFVYYYIGKNFLGFHTINRRYITCGILSSISWCYGR
jgi:hypothetical protein